MIETFNGSVDPGVGIGVIIETPKVPDDPGIIGDPAIGPEFGEPINTLCPVHIAGMVPMNPCTETECRSLTEGESNMGLDKPYINPVFATECDPLNLYETDYNTWLFSFPFLTGKNLVDANAVFTLQSYNQTTGLWSDLTDITDNSFGDYWPFNTLPFKNYKMIRIIWCFVLDAYGPGIYRIKLKSYIFSNNPAFPGMQQEQTCCLASEAFCLQEFDCYLADRTVKFESFLGGKIGDINNDGKVFNMCGVPYQDSIRFYGFFGYEKTDYEEMTIEYATGQIKKVRDKALQKFTLMMGAEKGVPKWLIDRFKAYALMADSLLVSDYNWNNSDYLINRKGVRRAGGVAPDYKTYTRFAKVKIDFEESTQNVIKSSCCEETDPHD